MLTSAYESLGYQTVWNTYTALLNLNTIVKNIDETDLPLSIIDSKDLNKLLVYDISIFGTQQQVFLEKWISAPGSLDLQPLMRKVMIL